MNNNATTRVSVVSCGSYDREKIVAAVEQTFNHFGGIQSIIKKGTTVLLKPNWLKKVIRMSALLPIRQS